MHSGFNWCSRSYRKTACLCHLMTRVISIPNQLLLPVTVVLVYKLQVCIRKSVSEASSQPPYNILDVTILQWDYSESFFTKMSVCLAVCVGVYSHVSACILRKHRPYFPSTIIRQFDIHTRARMQSKYNIDGLSVQLVLCVTVLRVGGTQFDCAWALLNIIYIQLCVPIFLPNLWIRHSVSPLSADHPLYIFIHPFR